MNKNIIHTLASEKEKIKALTWNTKCKETFIQVYNKRIAHVQLLTFLKEKHYLDAW
jgi:hypothetical protein